MRPGPSWIASSPRRSTASGPSARRSRRGTAAADRSRSGVARLSYRALLNPRLEVEDSSNDQRIDGSLPVQGSHAWRGLRGRGRRHQRRGRWARWRALRSVRDNLDVVEFGCVFWQPLYGEPVFARLDGFKSELATRTGPLSSTSTTGFIARPGRGPTGWSSCSR